MKSKKKLLIPALLTATLLISASVSESLPLFRNLYQAKAGYPVSCAVCHQRQDWRLTPYAKEFSKLGGGLSALESLELLDPDGDGFSTKEEIEALSNPGDARSTPKKPGPWLSRLKPTFPPKKTLADVFKASLTYELLERPLAPEEVASIENDLGETLKDAEKYPTVFLVKNRDGDLLGRTNYAFTEGDNPFFFLVVMDSENRLQTVRPLGHKHKKDAPFWKQTYLDQYAGKNLSTLSHIKPPRGDEKRHGKIVTAVRHAIKIIDQVTE